MQNAQDHDPVLSLNVERDVLSHGKGLQPWGDCLAPAPKGRRQTELLEGELQLQSIALRLRRTTFLINVANDLQQIGVRARRKLDSAHFLVSFFNSLSTAANARSRLTTRPRLTSSRPL